MMNRANSPGFTFIELILAMAILLTVITGLFLTYAYCILLNQSNSNLITATNDAQYVLEQMKSLPYSQLAGYCSSPPTFNNLKNETVTPNCTIGQHVADVTVTILWDESHGQKNFSLSTCIAK
jgi:prepilin-type N-terminal cleavage/methylation domain-containing protein